MPIPPISPPSPELQSTILPSTLAGKELMTEEMTALEEMILELGK